MLHIDGSQGEGGGQILRTSLSMAMVTGTDIKIENIRAGRAKPGLMRQHLACVKAAQEICDAEISGAKVGSTSIIFKPQAVRAGHYEFSVGTAGSTMLIFQTVLPALALIGKTSQLVFHGGTHNMMAPSYDFIVISYAPILKRIGIELDMKLQRHGFYPQGGGQWSATIYPNKDVVPLDLRTSGKFKVHEAVVTSANIPAHVAKRELDMISSKCDWPIENMRIENVEALGGGNIVSLRLHYQHCSEVVEHVGKVGVSAERVAKAAIKDVRRYLCSDAVVGEHLADQLMLPMMVGGGGGVYRTLTPSQHSKTNRDVIHLFTDKRIHFEQLQEDLWQIQI
jgi:RNA 3'-terminal phosphate cyclase (ATP)